MMTNLKRLLSLVFPYWPWMLVAGICGALTITANIGLLAASAVLISQAALMPPLLDLMTLIVGVRCFGIARALLRYGERYLSHDVTFRILKQLRVSFYQWLEPLIPSQVQDENSSRWFQQITSDIETLQYFYLRVLAAPFIALLILVSSSLFLYRFSPQASGLLIALFLIGGVAIPLLIQRAARGLAARRSSMLEAFQVNITDLLQGLAELQAYGALGAHREKLMNIVNCLDRGQTRLQALDNLSATLIQYCSHLALLGGTVLSIPLISSGRLEGVYLAMIGVLMGATFEALRPLPLAWQELENSLAAAQHLFSISSDKQPNQQLEPDRVIHLASESVQPSRLVLPSAPLEILMENVSFQYRSNEPYRLKNISLRLPPGSKTALLGLSGAGKTTLTYLLLKYWPYYQGSIRLDGMELSSWPEELVREHLSVLSQDPYLFHASIWENILLARPQASAAELEAACHRAQLQDFINELPAAYETPVGEGGFKLSSGQRQRLALARIYLRNSPILILDEAIQNLDYLTAEAVWQSLHAWATDKTVLNICHSLWGLETMDQIIILDQGEIREQGDHQSLLARGGLYAQLWQLEHEQL